ncbi:MAG: 4Fe-4S binding protein [Desulfobulbaceae bacterium]|nr:4Fe-4S binding protein [Desulfobulbaceae bacterium]
MPKKGIVYTGLRRFSQLLALFIFCFLFIKTDYNGTDEMTYAVNLIFRLDPLLFLSSSLAARTFISLMMPAVVTIILTIVLGRFFCGWICPMGTLLDGTHKLVFPSRPAEDSPFKPFKYFLLVLIVTGALFGFPIAGYFDPFSILVRGLSLAFYPAFNILNTSFFTFTYQQAPEWVNLLSEPVYAFLKQTVLPFHQKYYDLALFSFFILVAVFWLEALGRRFFCRNMCPLGALFSVASHFSLLRGKAGSTCGKCKNCQDVCRMAAIDEKRQISMNECILCMDCIEKCPGDKISFQFFKPPRRKKSFALSRRSFVGALLAGVTLPLFARTRTMAKRPDPFLIRPPGSLPEEKFLGHCVRCGECMKICIGNALQPAFLEAGLEGMFSPVLKARTGYCEYNCTLCGQVCPTGAIRKLAPAEKKSTKIGHAYFDKNRCLPYAKGVPCIVCEEHCPTPEKAIQLREKTVLGNDGIERRVKQPYIIDKYCTGCGICENKCPLPDDSAIKVTSAGEARHPESALPVITINPY